jgi:hypothetical protein
VFPGLRTFLDLYARPSGRLPDFLCLGAQKAGTSTLYDLLRRHPEVALPAGKEVQYFSRHHHRPLRWYAARFAGARPDQRAGDLTPYYLFHPEAPGRISEALPHARLLVLVREPVARALSGYFHARRHGKEPLPVEAAFEAEEARLRGADLALAAPGGRHDAHWWHGYLARSRYDVQLARYRARFPASQLLVVRSEDLFADPEPTWARIQGFLGLTVAPPPVPLPRSNPGRGEAEHVPEALRARLRASLAPTYAAMRRDHAIEWPGGG